MVLNLIDHGNIETAKITYYFLIIQVLNGFVYCMTVING